jgi:hypothetical protein
MIEMNIVRKRDFTCSQGSSRKSMSRETDFLMVCRMDEAKLIFSKALSIHFASVCDDSSATGAVRPPGMTFTVRQDGRCTKFGGVSPKISQRHTSH